MWMVCASPLDLDFHLIDVFCSLAKVAKTVVAVHQANA
jgi:hypothetical protein